MTELIISLAAGLALLILLLVWAQRSAIAAGKKELSEAQETLTDLQLEPPPRALRDRIFDWQDWQYVSRRAPLGVQQLFLQERKAVALLWLRQTRRQTRRLIDFHRRAVRRNINLSPAVEVRLAARYMLFLLAFWILLALIWVRGPFSARRMVGYAAGLAEQLSLLTGGLLVGLDHVRLGRITQEWAQQKPIS